MVFAVRMSLFLGMIVPQPAETGKAELPDLEEEVSLRTRSVRSWRHVVRLPALATCFWEFAVSVALLPLQTQQPEFTFRHGTPPRVGRGLWPGLCRGEENST